MAVELDLSLMCPLMDHGIHPAHQRSHLRFADLQLLCTKKKNNQIELKM